jgi:hypothetical protein
MVFRAQSVFALIFLGADFAGAQATINYASIGGLRIRAALSFPARMSPSGRPTPISPALSRRIRRDVSGSLI